MNILIVEDEVNLAEEIAGYLSDFNYHCHIAHRYLQSVELLEEKEFAVILLDLKLPDGNGINLIHYVKRKKISSGIIVLSANDELDLRINALDAGADDFLIKPFHLSELNARVKALIRRNFHKGENLIEYNEIKVDVPKLLVTIHNKPVTLTIKEYDLLVYFIANFGKVITKDAISYSVWSNHSDMDVSNEIIYTHIKNLRKKLVASGCNDYIQSVYGIGYKFDQ
ncbi:MAG: response regulator transcription factor [Bacteroidota bacterium]